MTQIDTKAAYMTGAFTIADPIAIKQVAQRRPKFELFAFSIASRSGSLRNHA